jgi:N-acetylmuramoyl-L-alanine amidase
VHLDPAKSRRLGLVPTLLAACLALAGCATTDRPGTPLTRHGDEIMVAGQLFHTGTTVVLWTDPGGYDGYRVERRFVPLDHSDWATSHAEQPALTTPNRYGLRRDGLDTNELESVRGGGWTLPELQAVVDQFVLHYDACGTSRRCFQVLHDERGLSVHFMLDLDGTIYQTLDLKERAWHATTSNSRSVGIEIANVGAVPPAQRSTLEAWYQPDAEGVHIIIPERVGGSGIRTPGFIGRPARPEPVTGVIQDELLLQYDFTPQQYAALAKLTATLIRVFPKLRCDFPQNAAGDVIPHKLPEAELAQYQGVLGHYHIQTNKVDPGPAFQWDRLIQAAREAGR